MHLSTIKVEKCTLKMAVAEGLFCVVVSSSTNLGNVFFQM